MPTARGWAFAGVGAAAIAAGVLLGRDDLLLIGIALVVCVGLAVVLAAVTPPRLTARREVTPARLFSGDRVEVTVHLAPELDGFDRSSRRRRRAAARAGGAVGWTQPVAEPGRPSRVRGAAVFAPAEGTGAASAVFGFTLSAARRGRLELGPVLVRRPDPLGLAVSRARAGEPTTVLVAPRLTALSPLGDAGRSDTVRDDERVPLGGHASTAYLADAADSAARRAGSGHVAVDEPFARPYRSGDAVRRVHWPATARAGELMVRQDTPPDVPRVATLVIVARSPRPAQLERLLEFAASIGVRLLADGRMLRLGVAGARWLNDDGPDEHGANRNFSGSIGVESLLGTLAESRLAPVADSEQTGPDPVMTAPVVALVGADVDPSWRPRVGSASTASLRLGFLFERADHGALRQALGADGWLCIDVAAEDGVERAWERAGREVRIDV